MKASFTLVIVCMFWTEALLAQTAKDYAVPLQVTISENPPSISLKWPADTAGTGYRIFRKGTETKNWGQAIATLPMNATTYSDSTVTVGTPYEYYVQRQYADSTRLAHGYIHAAIKKKISNQRNTILLLVDDTYRAPLYEELLTLIYDLTSDGWALQRLYIPRTDDASAVKAKIKTVYNNCLTTAPLSTVFIIGHVAVPYSGGFVAQNGNIYPPDGHPDHGGAWATDTYYGSLDESIWTDAIVNDTSPARIQNKNIPGDGKFDLMYLGDNSLALEVGRIDFTDIPAFGLNDTELTRQYLNKLHAYKMGETPVYKAGLIDDNFGAADGEAFASSAWNDFTTFFGDSVFANDYVAETRLHPYLFTYGCGFGSYLNCFGVVNTSQFANDSIQQIFTILFGSYFGDWDSQNNLLRAALASKTGGLVSMWSGRPYWHLHHMALGNSIGYSTRVSQNNYFENAAEPSGYASNTYSTFVNVNLMGDPTLRLHMHKAMLPIKATSAPDSISISVSWPAIPGVSGYEVSKTTALEKGFFARVEVPAGDTSWTDLHPYFGYTNYMVRPIYLEQTPSGSYYNPALGAMAQAYSKNTVGYDELFANNKPQINIYPNPSSGILVIESTELAMADIEITDIYGKAVLNVNNILTNQPISLSALSSGYYMVTIKTSVAITVKKLIIN